MRKLWIGLSLLLALLEPGVAQEPLNVVATCSIVGDFVKNVGADLVKLTVLVGTDSDAHNYEPTPKDSVALADAMLVFENGLSFENWLDDLYRASGSGASRIVVNEGVETRVMKELEDSEVDPHSWHNPQNVMVMVDNIAAALVDADPRNEATYLANAAAYKTELEHLDTYMQAEVDKLPSEKRKLVTSHDSLGYFADRFGFEIIGAVTSSVSTESSDANAGGLARLIDTTKAAGVLAIFTENMSNADLIEQVATSAGVRVAPPLYTDALGEQGSAGATYLEMMRYNVETIVAALSQ
jgi:ABC-type Zn uptake system ZnuABC Zn-binding protein ZnuA